MITIVSRILEQLLEYSKKATFGQIVQKCCKITLVWEKGNVCQIMQGSNVRRWTLICSGLFPDNQLWQVFLFYQLYSKFQLWFHSVLILNFIYLIRTQLSHSAKLWCLRHYTTPTSFIVCAYFEKFDITYFKKSTSCFKPINSWLEKCGLSYSVEKFAWIK